MNVSIFRWGATLFLGATVIAAFFSIGVVPLLVDAEDTNLSTLTLHIIIVNDNGGSASTTAWTLSATGTTTISGLDGSVEVTNASVPSGTYALSENGASGYTESEYSCTINDGAPALGNSVTLLSGEVATCTVTNDDIVSQLRVIKHVVNNNGGTAFAPDFSLHVEGTSVSIPTFLGNDVPNGKTVTLNAGAYSVSETSGPSGYSSSISSGECGGTIGVGESKTCTITSDDQPGNLTVITGVNNDNGGSKAAGDFTMHVSGTNASNTIFSGNASGTVVTLDVGPYSVLEDALNGYATSSSAECVGTIAVGEAKTCAFTNTSPKVDLSLEKTVSDPSPDIGQNVTFTITLTNNGPVDTTGIVVTDVVPPGLVYVSDDASASGTTYGTSSGAWTIGSLSNGSSTVLRLVAEVGGGTAGVLITNTASISLSGHLDPNTGNNSASKELTVNSPTLALSSLGGGGGGGGGGVYTPPPSQVLGAAIGPVQSQQQGLVLGAAAYNFSKMLQRGSTGQDVIELQKILIAGGYLQIEAPTGYFGAMTEAAVKAYQSANGLEAVGIVGPKTRALLNKGTTVPAIGSRELLIQQLKAKAQELMAKLEALKAKQGVQ